MTSRIPSVSAVMLALMGVFQITASFGTFIPTFVHNRVPDQFIPVWTFLTRPLYGDAPNESVVRGLAILSQYIIGISEAVIGVALLGAVVLRNHRMALANFGLAFSIGLFGAFMLTMFAMHDYKLPRWNQYPAMLAWIGVTWLVVALTDKSDSRFTRP